MSENKHSITVTNDLESGQKIFGKKPAGITKDCVIPDSMPFLNLMHEKEVSIWVDDPKKEKYCVIVAVSKTCEFILKKKFDVGDKKMTFLLSILNPVAGGPGGEAEGENVTVTINEGREDEEQ